jgi:ABC-type lipoprotein export system ATPase subunit
MIAVKQLTKSYRTKGGGTLDVFTGLNLEIGTGEFVVIRGPSGCGKTTLLLALGGMLRPTSGHIDINGTDIYDLDTRRRAEFRASSIGFVFQMFHLIPYLDVFENVLLGICNRSVSGDRDRAKELIERLGISSRKSHRPSELSAGERQRAAIARALINQPKLILADEPTGNLDPDNAAEVVGYLAAYRADGGTVIMVTHGSAADQVADRVIQMEK